MIARQILNKLIDLVALQGEIMLSRGHLKKEITLIMIFIMAALIIPMLTTADEAGNDSFENAEEITEGTHTGSLDQTDELDYYKILLDPSTIISITFSSQTENDQKLILCDPTQEERFDLRSSLEVEETDVFYLANETVRDHWFIKVDSFWSDGGNYSFRVDLDLQDDAGSGGDVNEDHSGAYEIDPGVELNGTLADLDEVDMYKIEIDPGSIVEVSFSSGSEMDQKLQFMNPNKEVKIDLRSSLEAEKTDIFYLANETVRDHWFIKVDSFWSDGGNYSFRVDLDLQDDAGSGGDVNEDHSGAYEIDPGVELNGTLADLDEVDMYKIEIDPGSIVEVSFSSGSEMDQKLQFMNPNKEVKIDLRSSMEAEETDIFYLANETVRDHWFVKVERYYSDHGSYSFKVDLDLQDDAGSGKDVSGDHSEAFQIDTNIEFNGIVGDLDEMDMYKVELEPGSMVKINFTCNAENDQKLRFMDPTKDEIFSLSSSEGVMENDVFYLANETVRDHWFVKVERYYSDHGSYSFKVDLDLQDDAGSGGDVSSEYDDPYEIEHNLAYEGVLGYLDEVDIYSIFIDMDTEVTVNFTAEPEDGFDLELLDPGRSEELSIRSSRGSEESGTIEYGNGIEAGYWYIKIETWSGVSGQYSLETHIVTTDGPSPVEISRSSVTDSSVAISWTESDDPDFDRYEIYMSSSAGDVGELSRTIDPRGTTSHEVTDLDPDTSYYFTVRVYDMSGEYADSDQLEVVTDTVGEVPSPVEVSGSSVTDSSVTISWTESDDPDFDRYEIYMSSSAGDVGELAGTIDSRGTTSHEVTDLDPDTTYFIRVNAVSKDGGSVMSDQVSVSTEDEDEKEGPALVFIICGVVLVLLIIVLVFVAVIFIVVKAVSGSKKDEE